MRYRRSLIFCSAIVFAVLGLQSETDVRRSATRAPASASKTHSRFGTTLSPSTGEAPIGNSRWPSPGERWIYRFERKAAADFGGKPWLRLKIGGRAAVEALEAANHGANHFYRLSFETDRLELQGETRAETRTFPGARIEVDAAGKVRELRFVTSREGAAVVTEEEADFVRDLAAQWLFFENRTRLGLGEVEWSSVDAGPNSGKRVVTKRILRYSGRAEITKLDSNHEWAVGSDERSAAKVDRIEGVENFSLASAGGDLSQSTSYKWVWISTEKVEAPGAIALGSPFTIEESVTTRASAPENRIDPARVAREWSRLKDLAPHDRLKLFRDAKRALDDGASGLVSLIVQDLKGKTSTSLEWRTGVGALAASSNPEAAKALLSLFRENGRSLDEKLSILSGVAAGEGAPAPEWKQTFETALDHSGETPASGRTDAQIAADFDPARSFDPEAAIREASLYALGSSIRKEADVSRRQELETVLWREVKEARTEKAQTAVLEAIGNSGSGEYYAYVREQFAAGTPKIRAKAVAAVRFLAAELAKPIIDRAKADPAASVRKVAEWSEKFQSAAAPDLSE